MKKLIVAAVMCSLLAGFCAATEIKCPDISANHKYGDIISKDGDDWAIVLFTNKKPDLKADIPVVDWSSAANSDQKLYLINNRNDPECHYHISKDSYLILALYSNHKEVYTCEERVGVIEPDQKFQKCATNSFMPD